MVERGLECSFLSLLPEWIASVPWSLFPVVGADPICGLDCNDKISKYQCDNQDC